MLSLKETDFEEAMSTLTVEPIDILLVEDNPRDVELTLRALKKNKISNRIQVVRDGEQALEFLFATGAFANRATEVNPWVVLLDLMLPKVDGLEVLQRIKNDPKTQTIPVVVLTSSQEERDVVTSYNLGVNSYIVKPVDFEQFNEAMRTIGFYWLLLNQPPKQSNG